MNDKERAFLLAVAALYPELPDLGARDIFADLHGLLLKGIAGESIETDVNNLLFDYEDADDRFAVLRKEYNAVTKSTTRYADVKYEINADSEETLTPTQVIPFPDNNVKETHKIDSAIDNLILIVRKLFDAEKDERAGLLPELKAAFQNLLQEQNVPEDIRDDLTLKFMVSVNESLEQHEKRIPLPEKPPEMWKSGQGETALQFLQRVYRPWLEAKLLTYSWLRKADFKLFQAVKSGLRKNISNNPELLPLTESERLNQQYEKYSDLLGKDVMEEIYSIIGTHKQRGRREVDNGNQITNE